MAEVVVAEAVVAATPAPAPARPIAVVLRRSGALRWGVIGVVVLLGAVVAGVLIGPGGPIWWRIPLEVLDRLPFVDVDSGMTDNQWRLVQDVRLPRVVLGVIVGATLSLAGASYQGVFRNPLVDPYLLGAGAGAGLGATLVFTVLRSSTAGWPIDPAPVLAFVFAVLTVFLTYVVGASFGGSTGVTLVLAGVAIVSLATAIQTSILQRNTDVVREVYSWILGRLSVASWDDVVLVLPYVVVAATVLLVHRRHLDLFRVGEDEATTLGAPVARVRLVVVVAATLATAAVVSVSGLIGFVGIIVPHTVRLLAGSSYRRLLPLSILFGGAFLVLADIPARMLIAPAEIAIGVVTAFLGVPFFLVLLYLRSRA